MRTGYKFFPFAASQYDQWWVLRFNFGFPEHDMYTLFIDGKAAADITGAPKRSAGLVRNVAALEDPSLPLMHLDPDIAASVVGQVAHYVNYGSEHGDPCDFCCVDEDGMTRI